MRLTGSRAYIRPTPVPKMPPGMVELMEDLTRDVLKNNPPDVYEFCAEHMRKLLEIRDGPSLKHPLTLEQKIARAQEKIRKRGDAHWQKYLKERKKEISHSQTTLDHDKKMDDEKIKQSSPTVQPALKPPVYPDLNTKNASEIEISHQPGYVTDLPVNIVQEKATNNSDDHKEEMDYKEETYENKELTANVEKPADLEMPTPNEDKNITIINTIDTHNTNATQGEIKEVISNLNNNINTMTSLKSEVEEHQIPMEEAKREEKENNEAPSDPPKNPDESKKEEVLVKQNSMILETAPTQEIPAQFENLKNILKQETEIKVNKSIIDMEKIVNTAVCVHNVLSENSRSPSKNAKYTNDINDGEKEENNQNRDNTLTDDEKADFSKSLSINDNELLSNTVIIANDNDNIEKTLDTKKNESPNNDNITDRTQQHIAFENSSIQITQDNKSEVENNNDQPKTTIAHVVEESDITLDGLKNSNLDNTSQKILKKNNPSDGDHNFKPPIIHVNDVIEDNSENDNLDHIVSSGMNEVHESSKELVHFQPVDTLDTSNGIQVQGVEPSANILDIHETKNTHDPNDGNIIEIRISQVAEALNNEEPLNNADNVKILEKAESVFVPAMENEVNVRYMNVIQNGDDTVEENEAFTLPNCENVDDTPSTITLVDNTDDAHNAKTSDAIKSISIDESTDDLENTSLIESGTSEATDDVIQHKENNNSMDLETAAVTIQKVFRSFLFKSRASTFDDNEDNISLDEDIEKKDELDFQVVNANLNKERRGISRMDTVLQTVNEEKSLSLSTDDSSTLSSAATTIQAHVRGFLVRNKLHSHKTASSNSLVNSDGPSASSDGDVDHKNKTVLNIHIVPEGGNYLSRDESMFTSMELSLDGSPPSSLNLHPLGYNKNERRKQLKREDAIQSISPPSNNSGKLSEDVDSVKDLLITEGELQTDQTGVKDDAPKGEIIQNRPGSGDTSPTNSLTIETVIEAHKVDLESSDADPETPIKTKGILTKQSSDESDVVTPFEDKNLLTDSRSTSKLLHSGEFHDIVLPTKVSRSDASVVSEFKNVLVYFLLWNNS